MRWLCVLAVLAACHTDDGEAQARARTGGDPERGRLAIRYRGCGSCHEIPRVGRAASKVGPSLEHVGTRMYLAGALPNQTTNLVRWIRFPQQVLPGTVMPDMGIPDAEARDIAAFLYTLR